MFYTNLRVYCIYYSSWLQGNIITYKNISNILLANRFNLLRNVLFDLRLNCLFTDVSEYVTLPLDQLDLFTLTVYTFQQKIQNLCNNNMGGRQKQQNCSYDSEQGKYNETKSVKDHGSKFPVTLDTATILITANLLSYHAEFFQN